MWFRAPKPGRFTDRQIELVQTFADQAVIAIENVAAVRRGAGAARAISSEALQQQTATADVLKVISRSAFDLQAVFNTLIASAVELCGAFSGDDLRSRRRRLSLPRQRGRRTQSGAPQLSRGSSRDARARRSIAGRVLLSGKVEAIPRSSRGPGIRRADAMPTATPRASLLGVPLLRNDGVEGALVLTRKEPGHFTQRQIEIVQTFADQAVIAIENVRLFDEVQARTRELAASLDDLRKAQDRLVQIGKARLARPAHRRHRPRDQEPAQFRQQFLGAVARTDRRARRGARKRAARRRPSATRSTN